MAQIAVGGEPYSMRMGMDHQGIPTVQAAPFDAVAAAAEDSLANARGSLPMYGRVLQVDAGLYDSGVWSDLPNGDRLWRVRIASEGALATELFFEDLSIPTGAMLYVYDDAGQQVLGGFTSYNNRPSGLFSTAQIMGPACIVEYWEPAVSLGEGHLRIASLGHAYRHVADVLSGECEVDVNCSEGSGWAAQRDAVVRLSVKTGNELGWCSGALVNNVTLDCKPYFLTAHHCSFDGQGNPTSSTDFQQWKFYFKYERPNCGSGTALAGKVLTGCTKRGESNDNGGDSGSDFLLVEAEDATIPDSYDPYWSGWDASGTGSTGGKGIHHPAGDAKKISTFTGTTVSTSWGGVPSTHWRVVWVGTANGHGVTEGGSSGSPLFNNSHRIIGTLTGGSSFCEGGLTSPDYYGKMSYHWASDPGPASERLKSWLDPNSTGTLSMDGSYGPCGQLGTNDLGPASGELAIAPNPASGSVVLQLPQDGAPVDRIEVLDVTGRMICSFDPTMDELFTFDVSGWSNGTYLLRLLSRNVQVGIARMQVAR